MEDDTKVTDFPGTRRVKKPAPDREGLRKQINKLRQREAQKAFPYEREMKTFVDAMRYKMIKNAHKGRWEDLDLKSALQRLKEEVKELETAINQNNEIEIILESADVANFAMMVSNIAIRLAAK